MTWSWLSSVAEIRDCKLYPRKYGEGGFDTYCRERWGMSKALAGRLIVAAETVTIVTGFELPAPASESVARELAPLREQPDVLRTRWASAIETADPKKGVTADHVKDVVWTGDTQAPVREDLIADGWLGDDRPCGRSAASCRR